jgi:hypothetical protein
MGDIEEMEGIEGIEGMENTAPGTSFGLGELSPEVEGAIVPYLTTELGEVINDQERQEFIERVKKWRNQRDMLNEEKIKNFPWEGSSNVASTMTLQNSNGAYSVIKRALGTKKPFFTIEGTKKLHEVAKALERLLDIVVETPELMNIRESNREVSLDLSLIGTEFVRVPWTKREWNFKKRDKVTGEPTLVTYIEKDCPELIPIPIEDIYTRVEWPDPQRAPWIGVRHWLIKHELKQREASGVYKNVDEVLARGEQPLQDTRIEALNNAGLSMQSDRPKDLFDIFEINMYWDVDEDGLDEDIKIWFDLWSGKILRWELNEFVMRDLFRIPFIERPGQLYAMGVGWILETLTDAAKALQDMRIDGTKLAAFQMYVTSNSSNIGPNEEFFPLKNIRVNNVKEDFLAVKFPDIGPGTLQAEYTLKEDASRATGVSDAMMGFPDQTVRTRYTTSGAMFQAQQNSALMDTILEGIENVYSQIGRLIVMHLIAHPTRTREIAAVLEDSDRQLIEGILQMEPHEFAKAFRVSIKSTEAGKTEDARQRALLTMTQLYTLYGQQMFQLLPMVYAKDAQVPPEVKVAAAKFMVGGTKLMEKVFNQMDHPETDDYMLYVKDLEMMLDVMENQKDQRIAQMQGGEPNGAQRGRA